MKKALSVLLAGAMVASMSVSAFAADVEAKVYNDDGKASEDVFDKNPTINLLTDANPTEEHNISCNIDGVLPGVTFYIPLGKNMTDKVKSNASYDVDDMIKALGDKAVKNAAPEKDKNVLLNNATLDTVKDQDDGEGGKELVYPSDAYKTSNDEYLVVETADFNTAKGVLDAKLVVSLNSLTNKDYFKFDVDKDDGSKYIKKVNVKEDKKLGDLDRTAYLEFILNDSTTTSDLKSTGTITFEAKDDSKDEKDVKDEAWKNDEKFTINYTFWINNVEKKGSDEDAETGDRVFFNPESNEDNTFVWGDDRAALFFEGNDDASKFYARLQTKADSEIYANYGDPVNADLWFYDFVGNPTVPSTSRATLTLGIPWDEDDDYTPRAEDCYIYEMDADGYLTDVTDRFTYDEENDGSTEIEGWTIKTRTLGTYVISDTELDVTVAEEVEEVEEEVKEEDAADAAKDDVKAIPNTGSSDMVGAAVVAAVASLAAAGAVAFKKASK